MNGRRSQWLFCLLVSLLLIATWRIYAGGMLGGFLFDDFATLPALGSTGPVDNWPSFVRYITSGHADPLGRPLALASFLVDAKDWPANPWPFKRTNLVIHLINGTLLAFFLKQLGKIVGNKNELRISLAAWLAAAFWMLHPLFVSTTLYIVQREAMLSAAFTLLGLLFWLQGRSLFRRGKIVQGLCFIGVGLVACTALATLCKANGMLLPVFALIIELIFLRGIESPFASCPHPHTTQRDHSSIYFITFGVTCVLPSLLISSYLIYQGWLGLTEGVLPARPWTLGQRLLTEPRVLIDYLDLLWLPRPFTPGLFNDQFYASTSISTPWTTVTSLSTVIALITGAWFFRRTLPTLSLAAMFFFVGQSVESSTIPLELYFEHRNYLPSVLMFWPLSLWLCNVNFASRPTLDELRLSIRVSAQIRALIAITILFGLGSMTSARANLWGNSQTQALLWAQLNPESPRAQIYAADAEMDAGRYPEATNRLKIALAKSPQQAQIAMNLFDSECRQGHVDQHMISTFRNALVSTQDPGTLLFEWFDHALDEVGTPPCPELSIDNIEALLAAAKTNPKLDSVEGRRQDLIFLEGKIALMQGDADRSLTLFNRALDQDVRPSAALQQAALLGSMGFPRQGIEHLNYYDSIKKFRPKAGFGMVRVHDWVLDRQAYWPNEIAHLRITLSEHANQQRPYQRND